MLALVCIVFSFCILYERRREHTVSSALIIERFGIARRGGGGRDGYGRGTFVCLASEERFA